MRQEKFALAEYHYRRALQINPQNPVLYCQLGNVLHKNAKFDEALAMLRSAAEKTPANPQVQYTRAEILDSLAGIAMDEWEQRAKLEEALVELEAVRSAVPKEAQIHYKLGAICKKLGRKDEALRHFTFAYDLDPKDSNQVKVADDGHGTKGSAAGGGGGSGCGTNRRETWCVDARGHCIQGALERLDQPDYEDESF